MTFNHGVLGSNPSGLTIGRATGQGWPAVGPGRRRAPDRLWSAALAAAIGLSGCTLTPGRAPEITRAAQAVRVVVETGDGPVMGVAAPAGRVFLGLPYAAPPTGALRWAPPQPVRPWRAPRDAAHVAPFCPQALGPSAMLGGGGGLAIGREDCLYLNVYTPPDASRAPPGGWPVMVFLPGGAFILGAGDNYDPSRLATAQGLVAVTANYRLGALGFLALPALAAESPAGGSGNYGLLDQQAALRWVKANIAAFGGDPAAVTLAGESAGAWSVCDQLASPGARGLFARAVVESGSCTDPVSSVSESEAARAGPAFAASLGCGGAPDALACLRALPAGRIVAARSTRRGISGPHSWGPVWGDPVLPTAPLTAFAEGLTPALPAIVGTNLDEGRLFAGSIRTDRAYGVQLTKQFGVQAARVLARYPPSAYGSPRLAYGAVMTDSLFACPSQTLRTLMARRAPVWAYEFADPHAPISLPSWLVGSDLGAYHASELAYVFDAKWALADPSRFDAAQAALSARMMAAWGRFVRGQAPDGAAWPAFRPGQAVMELTPAGDRVSRDFAARHACDFWATVPRGAPVDGDQP